MTTFTSLFRLCFVKIQHCTPLPIGTHLGLLSHLPADVQVMASTLGAYPTSHVTLAVSPYSVNVYDKKPLSMLAGGLQSDEKKHRNTKLHYE